MALLTIPYFEGHNPIKHSTHKRLILMPWHSVHAPGNTVRAVTLRGELASAWSAGSLSKGVIISKA